MWNYQQKPTSVKLDRAEIVALVDRTLREAKMQQNFDQVDIDDLQVHFNTMEDGKVSQSEMYSFLQGMSEAKPPGENYILFRQFRCCSRLQCCDIDIVGFFKKHCKRSPKAETKMKVETTKETKKKKKEQPVQRDLLAMTSTVTEPDASEISIITV